MRHGWLVMASLLLGGGAAQAQQYPIGSPAAVVQSRYTPSAVAPPVGAYQPPAVDYPPMGGYQPYGGVGPLRTPEIHSSRFPTYGAVPTYAPPQPFSVDPLPTYAGPPGQAVASSPYNIIPVQMPATAPPAATSDPAPASVFPPEFGNFHRPHNDRFWLKGAFVVARMRNGPQDVPLVTRGAAADPNPGALSPANPGTAVLFGGNGLNFHYLGGFRAEGGVWLGTENHYSVDVGALVISPGNVNFTAGSDGIPVIARPIFNARLNRESSFLTSFPNAFSGFTNVDARSEFWSIEINARQHAYWYEHLHAEGLFGFRVATLRESIRIQDNLTETAGGFLVYNNTSLNAGDRLFDQDLFRTANRFYGLQAGSVITADYDWVTASFFAKLGVGVTDRQTVIDGVTSLVSPGLGNSSTIGGVLAQVTNIGNRHTQVIGLLPEFGANLGLNLTKNIRATAGYSFLMWTDVVRPGTLIDPRVNDGLAPGSQDFGAAGPPRPAFVQHSGLYYLQTVNLGLEFHY